LDVNVESDGNVKKKKEKLGLGTDNTAGREQQGLASTNQSMGGKGRNRGGNLHTVGFWKEGERGKGRKTSETGGERSGKK